MRKLIALVMVTVATFAVGPVRAADLPFYPPVIDVPDVDYGVAGSFYLRGSAGANLWWTPKFEGGGCACLFLDVNDRGYGYSLGAGFGYETGNGLRADVTLDYLNNSGLALSNGYKANLRGGLALANVYYDFNFSGLSSSAGGFGAYVGAGLGAAWVDTTITDKAGVNWVWGDSFEAAGAVMAGVTYDMGAAVADIGYRGVYLPTIGNTPPNMTNAYNFNNNWIHEVRGTLRYRFN